MNTQTLSTILLFFICLCSKGQDIIEASFYNGTFEELKILAKKTQKPILLDFTATWCGPCRKMDEETYSDIEVATLIAKEYIAYKVDVDKIDNLELTLNNKILNFPTVLFMDYNGKVSGRLIGFYLPEYFYKILEQNLFFKRKNLKNETEFTRMVDKIMKE
ncbi:MAG: thioredoxin family protein [Pseudarcicella sp.]|nr:thioredoxin family protein [Pseudarcicella sp.]